MGAVDLTVCGLPLFPFAKASVASAIMHRILRLLTNPFIGDDLSVADIADAGPTRRRPNQQFVF